MRPDRLGWVLLIGGLLSCSRKPGTPPQPRGASHDMVADRLPSKSFKLHDVGNRFTLVVAAEPRISTPLTAPSFRSKAVIDTDAYQLVVQYIVEKQKLQGDAKERAHFADHLVEDLANHVPGKPMEVTLVGKPAIKVLGRSGTGELSASMVIVPEHDRRYLFVCSRDVTRCEHDVAAGLAFH